MPFPRTAAAIFLTLAFAGCRCATPPVEEKQRSLGEPCAGDTQCTTGLCDQLPGADGGACLQKCTAGCATSEICTVLDLNRFACVPEREGLCKACAGNSDCPYPADICVSVAAVSVCGRDCSFDGKCPTGYRCEPGFDLQGNQVGVQCQPVSGTCTCTPSSAGQVVPCQQSNSFGTCMGDQTCGIEGYSACSARTPAAELCNAADDDCDGQIDENLGQQSCGVGECARTVDNCADGGVAGTCTPGAPGTETCNEKDDDCDNVVDNGFNKLTALDNCGTCGNVCTVANGTPSCAAGACGIASCTAPFDNCNLQVPDGCEANTDTSLAHCGACNAPCAAPNSVGTCTGGVCSLVCAAGFVDLDGSAANGCEYACTVTSTTDFPDLAFLDANCDGIDGEVANSIFVSTAGNDANAGTRALPMRTMQAGLNAAVAGNKRDVLVSIGNYTTQISMPSNRGIYGAYAPGTWSRAGTNLVNVLNVNAPLLIENVTNVTVQLINFIGVTPSGASATAYGAMIRFATAVTLESVQIRAGNGTAGTSGGSGATGANGGGGSIGQAGCEDSNLLCTGCNQPLGGNGGTSSCLRTGGRGGNAARAGGTGAAGSAGVGGTSGGSGVPAHWANYAPLAPYVGYAGAAGANGSNGTSGLSFGTLNSFGYVVAITTGGGAGLDGNGGGGGGGGGGGETDCDSFGGGGAGGGAGACGGGGGLRGLSGGASIAVYLYGSTVTATGVALTTGNGGNGGGGGAGAQGGVGGPGGVASQGAGNEYGGGSEQDDGSNGARGGRGGDGGDGAAGGAGAGGPVVGVVRAGSSTWSATGGTTALGTPGNGGTSAAGNGATGLSQALY